MKITNGELMGTVKPFSELLKSKAEGGIELPVKVSLALYQLVQKLNEFVVPAQQTKDALIRQYGTAGKGGDVSIEPGSENWEKFAKQYAELLVIENEVVFKKVKLPDDLVCEPAIIFALAKFVE